MSDDLDLAAIIAILKARFRSIITITGVGALAAIITSVVMSPVYRAEAVVMPVSSGTASGLAQLAGEIGGFASIAGIPNLSDDLNPQEAIALLQSRSFITQFIDDYDLLPLLFASDWDSDAGAWHDVSPDEIPTLWDAYELFREEIFSVSEDTRTSVITISIEWRDPAVAAQWANILIARLNDQMRSRAVQDAESSLAFLNGQLNSVNAVAVRQSISNLIESQLKLAMLAKVREQYALKIIDPALPPDSDDPVAPKPILYTVVGLVFGLFSGLAYVIVASAKRSAASDGNDEVL